MSASIARAIGALRVGGELVICHGDPSYVASLAPGTTIGRPFELRPTFAAPEPMDRAR